MEIILSATAKKQQSNNQVKRKTSKRYQAEEFAHRLANEKEVYQKSECIETDLLYSTHYYYHNLNWEETIWNP